MKTTLFAILLTLSSFSFAHDANDKLPDDIEVYTKCVNGYLYVIVRDSKGIDVEQMTEPSDKGMVKTPLPIPCK